jgi:hypothetical protein
MGLSPRLKQILAGRKIIGNGALVDPQEIARSNSSSADPSGSAVYGVRLRPLGCWVADSNPARGMDVCLLCLYVVLSCVGRGLCDGLTDRLNSYFLRQFSYSLQRCLC